MHEVERRTSRVEGLDFDIEHRDFHTKNAKLAKAPNSISSPRCLGVLGIEVQLRSLRYFLFKPCFLRSTPWHRQLAFSCERPPAMVVNKVIPFLP